MSTDPPSPTHLRFGIPSLDVLLGSPPPSSQGDLAKSGQTRFERSRTTDKLGIVLYDTDASDDTAKESKELVVGGPITICIAGAAGVGKSILALHLASRYAADTCHLNGSDAPHIIYASTDLSETQARRQWNGFSLDQAVVKPHKEYGGAEREPFFGLDDPFENPEYYSELEGTSVTLAKLTPDTVSTIQLDRAPIEPIVHFLDLQATTAGDDWQFLNNILGQLPDRAASPSKHLVVVDAVEGLEALTGTEDAFGMARTRRSRITQIIRNASEKCHLLFIIEGGIETDLPEQFSADVVMRLRNVSSGEGYLRRTVEVEKVRGQSHVRGQHLLHFRRGHAGSSTGGVENVDDPNCDSSFAYVVPSLDLVERTIMRLRGDRLPPPRKDKVAPFGIRYLDNMLRLPKLDPPKPDAERGLPCGSVTALTGDDGTQKSRLVQSFLARNFISLAKSSEIESALRNVTSTTIKSTVKQIKRVMAAAIQEEAPFSVYFTTKDIDATELAEAIARNLTRGGRRWRNYLSGSELDKAGVDELIKLLTNELESIVRKRILCRRLERHNLSPAQLFHIIRSNIRYAQMETARLLPRRAPVFPKSPLRDFSDPDRRKNETGHRIRVAIEDWQIVRDNYPEVRSDDRFLGFLLFYLAREGVTTLVAQTAPGQPEALPDQEENRLQKEAHYNIRTWRIRFGDIDRVAITAIPPIATDRTSQIRELTWESDEIDSSLTVDPILELFQGLRDGKPRLTPLRIRLNSESPEMVLFGRRLQQLLLEKYPGAQPADIQVLCAGAENGGAALSYEALRDLCHLRESVPLDHSLVFMVDEFWSVADVGSPSTLGNLGEYFSETTWRNQAQEHFTDPDGIFQPTRLDHATRPTDDLCRTDFFTSPNGDRKIETRDEKQTARTLRTDLPDGAENTEGRPIASEIDRVPFIENFGFLLCQERAWDSAQKLTLTVKKPSEDNAPKPLTVGDVWKALQEVSGYPKVDGDLTGVAHPIGPSAKRPRTKQALVQDKTLSWRAFLQACVVVSQHWSTREYPVTAFDLSRHSTESVTCLFLEIWASEIYSDLLRNSPETAKDFASKLSMRTWRQDPKRAFSLISWLAGEVNVPASQLAQDDSGDDEAPNLYRRILEGRNLPGYSHALYRTLLLLAEVLTWDSLTREEMSTRENADSDRPNRSVAFRVWYSTAPSLQGVLDVFRSPEHAHLPKFNQHDPLVMLQLPGAFSTRGDWFLSVSPGSSSQRLAERAVDLMSSFTSNLTRLELGTGLPVRDVQRYRTIRTPLVTWKWDSTEKRNHAIPAHYRDVMALRPPGTAESPSSGIAQDPEAFHCLWRSSLYDYDRQARVLQRWIIRELQFLIRMRQDRGHQWISGFDVYDELTDNRNFDTNTDAWNIPNVASKDYYDSWKRFADRSTRLIGFLMGASRWHGNA